MAAKNPTRYYPLHHYVLVPLSLLMVGYTIRRYWGVAGDDSEISRLWFSLAAVTLLFFATLVMLRQHYALTLQDRLARLEVRQRYFEVSGQRFAALEKELTLKQILTLRLAGDQELAALAQATAKEKLEPKAILARINDYQFDAMRV
jgi:4-amino-4-deoxy-L-arabinose transferase-like glycosyltransferase